MIKDSHPQLLSRELRFEALSLDEQTHVILVICVIRPWLLSYYLYYQAGHWLSILVMLLLLNCPAVSDSLGLHGLQHARPPCPLPSPEICPSSCPLHWSWWCHPALSSSDAFLSLCLQSFPASGTFPVSQLFTLNDQNTGVSTSASILSMITLKIDWLDLLAVQGTLRSLLQRHNSRASVLRCSVFSMVQLS